MCICPSISRYGKCVIIILAVLLLLQLVQFKLWTNLDGKDDDGGDRESNGRERQQLSEKSRPSVTPPPSGAKGAADLSLSIHRIFQSGRVDASGDYLVIDDVCRLFIDACQSTSADKPSGPLIT